MIGFYFMLAKAQRRKGMCHVSYFLNALAPIVTVSFCSGVQNKRFSG